MLRKKHQESPPSSALLSGHHRTSLLHACAKTNGAPGSLLQDLALTLRGVSTTHTRHVNFSQTLVCEQLKLGQRFRFSVA